MKIDLVARRLLQFKTKRKKKLSKNSIQMWFAYILL